MMTWRTTTINNSLYN